MSERDIASNQAIEVKQRDLEIRFLEKERDQLKEEKSSMLAKLGQLESDNRKYEQENFDMQRKSGILNILTEGLGSVLIKHAGIDGEMLNGILNEDQTQGKEKQTEVEVEVAQDETEARENKVAQLIYQWILTKSELEVGKIYEVMKYMSANTEHINELYELIKAE